MQILHHTFTFPRHIGPSAFYISYKCTTFYKMLLRILQNVMGEFSPSNGYVELQGEELSLGDTDHSARQNVPHPS